jgi:phage virion morphogenesis protein
MAGAAVEIDDREILDRLRHLQQRVGNLEPVFIDIGEVLLRSHRERFERQIAPDGERWAELSRGYLAEKPYNQDKILVLDGYLEGGLRYQTAPNQLQFGTNSIYGATHQFGREDANIPERPFLGLSADDEAEILARIQEHLEEAR